MKYFLVAGEPSGDQHGSTLMEAIRELDPTAEFRFVGGDRMAEIGGNPVIHIREMSFMGFAGLILRIPGIIRQFRICRETVCSFRPDVVIPVDYGGFNLRLIRMVHRFGFRSVYYITPKVWAWMPSRARRIARYTEKAICILPFEKEFLEKYGVQAMYAGNPVLSCTGPVSTMSVAELREQLGMGQGRVITLVPGSRKQEVARILPVMMEAVNRYEDEQIAVACHSALDEGFYRRYTGKRNVRLIYGNTPGLMRISDACLVTSGTATLEAALLNAPQVVCYRAGFVSYLIARVLIRVKYISLVNLILDEPLVEELIQKQCRADILEQRLDILLTDQNHRRSILEGYQRMSERIGYQDASRTAASVIVELAAYPR